MCVEWLNIWRQIGVFMETGRCELMHSPAGRLQGLMCPPRSSEFSGWTRALQDSILDLSAFFLVCFNTVRGHTHPNHLKGDSKYVG